MPKIQSAKKALRQNIRRNVRNTVRKQNVKAIVKEYKKLVAEGKADEAKQLLPKVYQVIDKTAKSKLIKKGKASRMKSRLTKKLSK